jgi:hypothetical protein
LPSPERSQQLNEIVKLRLEDGCAARSPNRVLQSGEFAFPTALAALTKLPFTVVDIPLAGPELPFRSSFTAAAGGRRGGRRCADSFDHEADECLERNGCTQGDCDPAERAKPGRLVARAPTGG